MSLAAEISASPEARPTLGLYHSAVPPKRAPPATADYLNVNGFVVAV